MSKLNDDLELLYELNDLRLRAKKLRRGGLAALRGIADISISGKIKTAREGDDKYYENWITSGNEVEAALLVRVQNHKDMSEDDAENDDAEASPALKEKLKKITLKSLFPSLTKTIQILDRPEGEAADYIVLRIDKKRLGAGQGGTVTEKFLELVDSTVPVLMAARAMHALVGRADTVFHRATMICYYRIVRELYFAVQPDWIIGAARANAGSDASAFVTGECIRAILAFENSIIRAVAFFRNTRELYRRHKRIRAMLDGLGAKQGHPLSLWADMAIERMWLNWYVSTNPRRSEIAVKQVLTANLPERADMKSVGEYLNRLPAALAQYVKDARREIELAQGEIDAIREEQNPYDRETGELKEGYGEEEVRVYQQTESAHSVAYRAIRRGMAETERAQGGFFDGDLEVLLGEFAKQFEDISRRIHRILEPAKRYVRTVVNRELAFAATDESGRFDPGELAFAAASLGATTEWRQNERLTRACELLSQNLPASGSLPTRRPFHSNTRGYRLIPIGCETARSFAQLLQRANHAFDPKVVRRMLHIFEENRILGASAAQGEGQEEQEERVAWNFEGAPHRDKPCVWVTATAVLALDRIVRMLNERINSLVLKNFEVIRPENPHTNLTLNNILYPDYGVSRLEPWRGRSIGVSLERMRAHVERAMLPGAYKGGGKEKKVYSVILYGPPGTGKTTLIEALALSSRAPLVRISPSDLTVQGQELIEGRARAVFEALSMLTQAVIILDEFEPVLQDRSSPKAGAERMFNFLMTGMLPKLVKLHDAAKKQSLVYCLATNYVKDIDDAAKRSGRFDLHLPLYNPDPLSRAGAFLYRAVWRGAFAGTARQRREQEGRLLAVVEDTAYASAGELNEVYFKHDRDPACFEYFFSGGEKRYRVREREALKIDDGYNESEKEERKRINEWEGRMGALPRDLPGDDKLSYCLSPERPGAARGAGGGGPTPRRKPSKKGPRRIS